jgi:GNAT superfamily N-acetyltransferase
VTHRLERTLDIEPLGGSQLGAMAALVEHEYARLREEVPALPADALSPTRVVPLLEYAVGRAPGVAATRDGELAGGIVGLEIPGLLGPGTAALVPDWACALAGSDRVRTLDRLYGSIAAEWVGRGLGVHCFKVSASDTELIDALTWLGFGRHLVDAVRDLEPRPAAMPPGVTIGPATAADLDALTPLALAYYAYYAKSPTFLVFGDDEAPEAEMSRWLTTPGEFVWTARTTDRVLSFLYLHRPGPDICLPLQDEGTISIGGAFTVPEARGSGVGAAVLEAAVEWARTAGYKRMSVDFETANAGARRFWLRTFLPVCVSLVRRIDGRLVPAEATR